MKRFKSFQWLGLLMVFVIAGIVSCTDSNDPTTPAISAVPTGGESVGAPSSLSLVHEASIGDNAFKVYAEKSINAAALLEGVGANDSAETIQSKMDANRSALYPDEQIRVDIELAKREGDTLAQASGYIYTKSAVVWWNNYNAYNAYWQSTQYAGATTLSLRVLAGSYDLYSYYDNTWNYRGLKTTSNGSSSSGYYQLRGFLAYGKSSYNKADIIMYFFY